jgi:uncharacterized damage-inducible protein DinB
MNLTDIQTLYAYNRWANERLFAALEKVGDDRFNMQVQSSFPSLRETMFHILFAEWLWLKRWQGISPRASVPDPDASPATWATLSPGGSPPVEELATVTELKDFAASIERERQEFLRGLDERALQAPLKFRDMAGNPYAEPLAQLMQHLVNHGTHHRGQATTMLRQIGAETAALDMLYFYRERENR